MQTATSQAQQPRVRVQCPYTASNCPLFNPSFSVEEVLSAGTPSTGAPSPFLPSPADELQRPSLVESMRRDSAVSLVSSAGAGVSPSISHYYTDYSIAPAPVPAASSFVPPRPTSKPAAESISSIAQPARQPPMQPMLPPLPPLSLQIPHPSSSALHAASFAATIGGSASSPSSLSSAYNGGPRRLSLSSGMVVPATSYSPSTSSSSANYPSPGRLVGQSGGYSYERRRRSVEEEAHDASFASSALRDVAAAAGLGSGGLGDAATAYELAGLAGISTGLGGNVPPPLPASLFPASQPRRASYGNPVLPAPMANGLVAVGGTAMPVAGTSSGQSTVKEEAVLDGEGLDEIDEDDEDDVDNDDEADADYIEGGRTRRSRTTTSGSVGSVGSAPEHKSAVTDNHVVPHATAESVTPFISKLYHLLSNPVYSDVIRWSGDGSSVLYVHTSQRLLETLSRFFRHSNLHSFSRQMNIYGFRRLTIGELLSTLEHSPPAAEAPLPSCASASEWSGFTHPSFFRAGAGAGACDLSVMKPMGPKTEQGRQNLAKKMAEGGRKRNRGSRAKSNGKEGDKPGGVRKSGVKE
ncbi:hypothetical protein JCM6882_003631 [Rhodosporidiobolus microsporus]